MFGGLSCIETVDLTVPSNVNFFPYFWNFTFKCLTKKEGKKVAEHDTADFYAIVSGKQYLSHIIHETDEDKVEEIVKNYKVVVVKTKPARQLAEDLVNQIIKIGVVLDKIQALGTALQQRLFMDSWWTG